MKTRTQTDPLRLCDPYACPQPLKEARLGGVRAKLAQLAVVCILPIALVAAALVYIPFERERIQVSDAAIGRARAMVSALDGEFAKTEAALLALSTSGRLASNDLSGFHAQATLALENIDAGQHRRNGHLRPDAPEHSSSIRPFGEPLPKLDEAPLLKQIVATGKSDVSDLFCESAPKTGEPIPTACGEDGTGSRPHSYRNHTVPAWWLSDHRHSSATARPRIAGVST